MNPQNDCIMLCPGQGAQYAGMGRLWFDQSEPAAAVYHEADRCLDMPLSDYCFNGPPQILNRTDIAQLAIYVTSVACFHAVSQKQYIGQVTAACGLSLGEFTALHLAGAFDFRDGLELVRKRGEAMQHAAEATPSAMLALIGATQEQAEQLCNAARKNDVLVPANFNCPGQIVISGSRDACERADELASNMNIKSRMLAVAGAFHSPIMKPAADQLADALELVHWNVPSFSVIANVTASPHDPHDIQAIKERLIQQLTSPVQWQRSMQWAMENVNGSFIELAPGKVLLGLMRKINRRIQVENFDVPQ